MKHAESIARTVTYSRKLASAGLSGVRAGHLATLNGRSFPSVLAESARGSLKLAAAGACVGLLRSYLRNRRGHLSNTIAYGALGSALGFCAGFTWTNRRVTSALAHSALKEIHKASDEHWLKIHPIDYA
jgi:hypothetical protein